MSTLTIVAIVMGSVASIVTSAGLIWRKAIAPVVHGVNTTVEKLNSVDELAAKLDHLHDCVETRLDAHTAQDESRFAELAAALERLERYMHDRFHEVLQIKTIEALRKEVGE